MPETVKTQQNIAKVSHEMRSPLNAIIGMNEMILRECKDPNILEYARGIEGSAIHLVSMIDNILEASSPEHRDSYSTDNLIMSLKAMFSHSAQSKGLSLWFSTAASVPKRLKGDITAIRQACINLLSNAVKYTDSGSIKFMVDCLPLKEQEIILKITVKDTGRGIEDKDINRIFGEYERAVDDTEGTGLGLSITRSLIEGMDGEITVESILGHGSEFTISVPQMVAVSPNSRHGMSFTAPTAKILVVDDESVGVTTVTGLLKGTKMRIDIARNAKECLRKVLFTGYDLILMDDLMPGMNGPELLMDLKQKHLLNDQTKVVIVTGNTLPEDKMRYLNLGFDWYISKPVRPKILKDTMLKFLPKRKLVLGEKELNTPDEPQIPEWLKNNQYIDAAEGMKMCGTWQIYEKTLISFRDLANKHIGAIKMAFGQNDQTLLAREIHSVKSMAALIGCMELNAIAKEQEFNCKDPGKIIGLYINVVESLAPLEGNDAPTKEEVDEDSIPVLFKHLKEYVEDFNDEAIGSMLKALSRYTFPEGPQQVYLALKEAHEGADWVKMKDILDGYENQL